ncbi:DDE-type integrase/transposase/recombinase [Pseudomonas asuensis]
MIKWRKRDSVEDQPMGPREPHSTSLTLAEEAVAIAFRQKTLLPLDDCLHALQRFIPGLSRSSLHRLYQRHGISNIPRSAEPVREKKAFKCYPLGYLHIDITQVHTAEGQAYLFVAINRTSKFVYAELHTQMMRKDAVDFLEATLKTLPYKVHTVLTDNGSKWSRQIRKR